MAVKGAAVAVAGTAPVVGVAAAELQADNTILTIITVARNVYDKRGFISSPPKENIRTV
jgi:hypothetical protein